MFGLFRKKPEVPRGYSVNATIDQVVPRIKHLNFLAAVEDIARQAGGATDRPVTTPFVGDLIISYAFDLPQTFQMVMTHDLERLCVTPEIVRKQAIKNFYDKMPPIELVNSDEEPSAIQLRTGYNLEACMLLVPEYWQKANEHIAGRVVAAVPTRNHLLFTSSESAAGIAALQGAVRQANDLPDRTHNLSKHLLVWFQNSWEVFTSDPTV